MFGHFSLAMLQVASWTLWFWEKSYNLLHIGLPTHFGVLKMLLDLLMPVLPICIIIFLCELYMCQIGTLFDHKIGPKWNKMIIRGVRIYLDNNSIHIITCG